MVPHQMKAPVSTRHHAMLPEVGLRAVLLPPIACSWPLKITSGVSGEAASGNTSPHPRRGALCTPVLDLVDQSRPMGHLVSPGQDTGRHEPVLPKHNYADRYPLAGRFENCQSVAELSRIRTVMPGKRVQFDPETWQALDLLAKDRMQDFQELADEAFADLLAKHGRPTDLRSALRQSVAGMEKRPPAGSLKRVERRRSASNDNGG